TGRFAATGLSGNTSAWALSRSAGAPAAGAGRRTTPETNQGRRRQTDAPPHRCVRRWRHCRRVPGQSSRRLLLLPLGGQPRPRRRAPAGGPPQNTARGGGDTLWPPRAAAFAAGVTVGVFLASLLVASSSSPPVDSQGPGDETSRPAPSAGRATRRIP